MFQIVLAYWQSKNRCLIVSWLSQKPNFWLSVQFILAKLSFVKITPRRRYQSKIKTDLMSGTTYVMNAYNYVMSATTFSGYVNSPKLKPI